MQGSGIHLKYMFLYLFQIYPKWENMFQELVVIDRSVEDIQLEMSQFGCPGIFMDLSCSQQALEHLCQSGQCSFSWSSHQGAMLCKILIHRLYIISDFLQPKAMSAQSFADRIKLPLSASCDPALSLKSVSARLINLGIALYSQQFPIESWLASN